MDKKVNNKVFVVERLKIRLDRYLAEVGVNSRSRIQRDIEAGLVKVNKEQVFESKFVVRKGDVISYHISPKKSQIPKDTPLHTLYNNHGLLIIDKPPGIAVHPGSGMQGDSLTQALLYHFKDIHIVGEEDRPGIVHRLDKDTSGCMMVALTPGMYDHLKNAFAERKVYKEYLALVVGLVEAEHGFIDTPIGKSKTDFRKYTVKNMLRAKESLTEYTVIERFRNPAESVEQLVKASKQRGGFVDGYTLIRVKLHTGRTHQIRVHMQSINHPVVGDALYGGSVASQLGLPRQFLHAAHLSVQLPDGLWIEAESKLPQDLRAVLDKLKSKNVKTL